MNANISHISTIIQKDYGQGHKEYSNDKDEKVLRSLWADVKEDDREATSNKDGEKNFDADEDHSENGLLEEHRADRMVKDQSKHRAETIPGVMTENNEAPQNMDKEKHIDTNNKHKPIENEEKVSSMKKGQIEQTLTLMGYEPGLISRAMEIYEVIYIFICINNCNYLTHYYCHIERLWQQLS